MIARKRLLILVVFLFTIGLLLQTQYAPLQDLRPHWDQNQESKEMSMNVNDSNTKFLLYGSPLHTGSWEFLFGYRETPFIEAKCKYQNCYLTSDNFNPIQTNRYSGVIFHSRDMCVPAHDSWVHHMRSVIKGPFMFVLLESPNHDCGFNFGRFNHVFNWTITYRRDSDLVLNYGGFEPVSGGNDFNPARINLNRKLVFWLVNHKGSPGGRDRYVHELEKHIKVHKHGGGTGNHCPPETRTLYGWECKAKLSKQYKFYLAFENSVCKDYATEKFYDVMKYDVVPVVYGLANYSALAPPHSYIDVRDFKSPKALGEYLTYLDKNDEEYLKYFKWRENYRVTDLRVAINKVLCDMCERVNHMEELRKTAHSAEELELWWRGTQKDRTCKDPKVIFPGMP